MDPNSSVERICLGEDNHVSLNDKVESHGEWDTTECYDTADSGQKKEFAIKLCLEHEVKNGDKVVKKEFIVALKGEIYFVKFIINPEEYDIEPGVVDILEGIDFGDIPEIKGIDVPPYVCKMGKSSGNKKKSCKNYKMKYDGKGPSLTINHALTREELSREELEKDLWERIVILNEPRPIIETLKYGDTYKKILDTVLLDKLKLDGELELEEIEANEEMKLGREQVKPVRHNVSMLNHSEAEPMGMIKDMLCQVGVTMVLARFLVLDMPVHRVVLIIVGRSFLPTCGGIINTLKGTTSTFDGVCHQKFYVVEIQNDGEECQGDDDEEYYLKRDEMGRPFYGPNLISYFDNHDPMKCALAIQDFVNPF
ncbi:hypothetical protein Tco_0629844 [Tanacetum coccineum]|uniref:Uncharacterized protein n=1 Tax=Tanacetum coccineum TaxID=301880 RepID=A0ABQ4WUE5_9ASTR